jgi:hypothetical protein
MSIDRFPPIRLSFGEFVGRFSLWPIAMHSVQLIHLCERGPHPDRVVVLHANKRETDERVTYFRAIGLGRAFNRIAFANAIYGFASLF